MQITLFVKPLGKPEKEINMDENECLQNLQTIINEVLEIPIDNQRLTLRGRPLTDPLKSLSEYGLKTGDRITLTTRGTIRKSEDASSLVPVPSLSASSSSINYTNKGRHLQNLLKEHLIRQGISKGNVADKIVDEFMQIVNKWLTSMTLDDIERMAKAWS